MVQLNRFPISQYHFMVFLILCSILMGCDFRIDWSDKDTDFLINQLRTGRSTKKRRWAAFWLTKKNRERDRAIPALTQALLSDEINNVRMAAVNALGSMKPPAISAIPALLEALQREDTGRIDWMDDTEGDLHLTVVRTLAKMGSVATEAIPVLMEVLRSDSSVFAEAGVAIFRIDPSMRATVKEVLLERLGGKDSYDRGVAIEALAKMADASLVPFFIQALSDPDYDIRMEAAAALGQVQPGDAKDAIPALTDALNDVHAYVYNNAADALGRIGKEAQSAAPALRKLLAHSEWRTVRSAADALRQSGDAEATPALIRAWENGPRYALPSVAKALGEIGTLDAIPSLLNTLRESEFQDVRIPAALALYHIDPSKKEMSALVLMDALAPDKHIISRIDAASALYQVDPSKFDFIMDVLKIGLSTKPPLNAGFGADPRYQAALAIAAIGQPAKETVPMLARIYNNPRKTYYLSTTVADALASIGDPSVPVLIAALGDKNYWTRDGALTLLKRIGTPEALRAVEAYERGENN